MCFNLLRCCSDPYVKVTRGHESVMKFLANLRIRRGFAAITTTDLLHTYWHVFQMYGRAPELYCTYKSSRINQFLITLLMTISCILYPFTYLVSYFATISKCVGYLSPPHQIQCVQRSRLLLPYMSRIRLPNVPLSSGSNGQLGCAGFTSRDRMSKTVAFLFRWQVLDFRTGLFVL